MRAADCGIACLGEWLWGLRCVRQTQKKRTDGAVSRTTSWVRKSNARDNDRSGWPVSPCCVRCCRRRDRGARASVYLPLGKVACAGALRFGMSRCSRVFLFVHTEPQEVETILAQRSPDVSNRGSPFGLGVWWEGGDSFTYRGQGLSRTVPGPRRRYRVFGWAGAGPRRCLTVPIAGSAL